MSQTKHKRRVLFLFAHLHKGGMQKAVSNISLALPNDFEQYIGYFGTENPGFIYKAKIHDFQLSAGSTDSLFSKITNAFRRLRAIRAFVKSAGIDVVVSFGEAANIYSLLSNHQAKKIITSRVHLQKSLSGNAFYTQAYRFFVNQLYPKADAVVAVSEELAKDMRLITKNFIPVSTISNLYHIQDIEKLAEEMLPFNFSFLEDRKFLLNVGSLCHQKGQDDLLKIFKQIHNKHPDIFLVILGRGEWDKRLKNQAELLGIMNHVIFIDFDLNPYKYMARAEVFVLTSRYEGFPNVLVEAMICNAPVVAFDCPTGPEEILNSDSSYGIFIKNRSIDKASEGICRLIEDPKMRHDACVKSKKRGDNYSAGIIVTKWIDILK